MTYFSDECVNFAIQKGLDASRSKIKYFRHNDTNHLQQLLEQQAVDDKKHPKLAKVSRRFLIVEGIYMNNGSLCNIEKMIGLKRKYKLRLFIDETVSFGTLGEHGRGITEHKNISVSLKAEQKFICKSLNHSLSDERYRLNYGHSGNIHWLYWRLLCWNDLRC